ncbi:MAG: alpha/beta hydrolase [Propionibacteriaceae bacterium]
MNSVALSAGTIDYTDSGGAGPVLVFAHGVPMSGTQWRKVLPLMDGYRCIAPTLPLGGHRHPMRPDTDLSQRGQARILGEFCEALDLNDVTLVLNDWGGGQFLLLEPEGKRISRLVLVACEAFDNFPPAPARAMTTLARLPGGVWLLTRLMMIPAFRRAKAGFGGMSLRGLPDEVVADWFAPATRDRRIRRDIARFSSPDRATLLSWSEELRGCELPVLVVWAAEDRLMPAEHGPRLAALYPHAELLVVPDSATLVPEDQPELLAQHLRRFLDPSEVSQSGGEARL